MLRQKSKLNKTVVPIKLGIILKRIEEMHFLTQQVNQEVLKQWTIQENHLHLSIPTTKCQQSIQMQCHM